LNNEKVFIFSPNNIGFARRFKKTAFDAIIFYDNVKQGRVSSVFASTFRDSGKKTLKKRNILTARSRLGGAFFRHFTQTARLNVLAFALDVGVGSGAPPFRTSFLR
jgi:hypothetical protein